MAEQSDHAPAGQLLSRRRFVQIGGVTGAAALAGCGGGETTSDEPPADTADTPDQTDTSPDSTDSGAETTVYDATFRNLSDRGNTEELQYNYLNSSNYEQITHGTMVDSGMMFSFAKNEYMPHAFADWTIDGTTVEINLREDLTWADGTDYTSADAKCEFAFMHLSGASIWDFMEGIDSINTPDEKTVELELKGTANRTIVEHALGQFATRVRPDGKWGEWYEQLKSQGLGNLSDDLKQEISEYTPHEPDFTCGPFVHENQDANGVLQKRNPEHPDAENINFSNYQWGSSTGNSHQQAQLVSGKVDGVALLFAPPRIVANMPDKIEETRKPAYWGYGLAPNHDREHLGNRRFRQAMQCAIDRETVVRNAGPRTKKPVNTPGGVVPSAEERWLGDEVDSYHTYDDPADGEQYLEAAGYSKDGGTWKTDNGKAAKLELTVFAGWSDFVTASQTIVSQLNQFGFDASLNSVPAGSVFGDLLPNSKFQLMSFWWLPGGPRASFPYYSLRHQFGYAWTGSNPHNYPAWNDGEGAEVTVPARNGSGETSINPVQRVQEITMMQDEQAVTEAVRDLHWVANVDQPMLPLQIKVDQSFYTDGGDWEAPDGNSEKAKVGLPSTWLPRTGDIRYVGE